MPQNTHHIMDKTTQQLHALLYAHGGELKKKQLLELLGVDAQKVDESLESLTAHLKESGLEVYVTEYSVSLRTAREQAEFIGNIQAKDMEGDLGTAGLEVLSIVLYKGDVSRATIDYIRGVNSSSTLRQLVMRGLLERTRDTGDSRAWVYTITPELLSHLGVLSREELPEFDSIASELTKRDEQSTHNG